jgi:hypothetical protein
MAVQFCESIRRNAANDSLFLAPTPKQLAMMNIQLNADLGDWNDQRVKVLSFILNLPHLTSTKQLTRHTVSVIIGEILDGKSKEIVREIAEHVWSQSHPRTQPAQAAAVPG